MGTQDVIIIHGLYGKKINYSRLIKAMKKDFAVHFFAYSMNATIPEISEQLELFTNQIKKFHVITYSFGSIILRNFAARFGSEKIDRVVMAVPPNQGSELLRKIMVLKTGQRMFGRLIKDFLAHELEYLPTEPELHAGVIAGTQPKTSMSSAINKFVSRVFDTRDSDGKVKIEETKLPYMKDFITIDDYHDGLGKNNQFIKSAIQFLKTGSFK